MSRSEFFAAVEQEFGLVQGRVILENLIVRDLGDVSALDALDAGESPKQIWRALCGSMGVPEHRWRKPGSVDLESDTPS